MKTASKAPCPPSPRARQPSWPDREAACIPSLELEEKEQEGKLGLRRLLRGGGAPAGPPEAALQEAAPKFASTAAAPTAAAKARRAPRAAAAAAARAPRPRRGQRRFLRSQEEAPGCCSWLRSGGFDDGSSFVDFFRKKGLETRRGQEKTQSDHSFAPSRTNNQKSFLLSFAYIHLFRCFHFLYIITKCFFWAVVLRD